MLCMLSYELNKIWRTVFFVIFVAGRPKAALLFWFFGDFRCGALLFMVIHVIYKYKNK